MKTARSANGVAHWVLAAIKKGSLPINWDSFSRV